MPTIIKKSQSLLVENRREIHKTFTWQVHSNVWCPQTDIYETPTGLVVRLEIAGMRDEDIEVVIQDNLLLISGKRTDLTERRAYHQMEIPFGRFNVNIELPPGVQSEKANAEYKDGFLAIYLPKDNVDT